MQAFSFNCWLAVISLLIGIFSGFEGIPVTALLSSRQPVTTGCPNNN